MDSILGNVWGIVDENLGVSVPDSCRCGTIGHCQRQHTKLIWVRFESGLYIVDGKDKPVLTTEKPPYASPLVRPYKGSAVAVNVNADGQPVSWVNLYQVKKSMDRIAARKQRDADSSQAHQVMQQLNASANEPQSAAA